MRRLAAALALGLVIPAGARPAVLERVEVVEDGGPLVRLHVSEPVTPVAHALPAEGNLPARIYLDLPVTALLPAAAPRRGVGPLLRVRLGRFDAGTVRVVLDLATAMPFTVETGTRTVNVTTQIAPVNADIFVSIEGEGVRETKVIPRVNLQPGTAHRLVITADPATKKFDYSIN